MILKSVDLPQPEGPMMPTNSPCATDSETPSTAMTAPSGVSNRLVMLSTARMAPPAAAAEPDDSTAVNAVATAMPLSVHSMLPMNIGGAGPYSTSRLAAPPATADQKCRCWGSCSSGQFRLIGPAGTPAPVLPGPVEGIGA